MARYQFHEEPRGGVGLEVIASDPLEVIDAAVAALNLFMWDQEGVREQESVELVCHGFNEGTALVALLSEILYRADNDDWVFKRFQAATLEEVVPEEEGFRKQYRIVGRAIGERRDGMRHRKRFPVRAVLLPKLKFKPHEEGWRFYAILDA